MERYRLLQKFHARIDLIQITSKLNFVKLSQEKKDSAFVADSSVVFFGSENSTVLI